ncbi:MAG: nucleotide-binding protein [Rhodospirillales bacterium]|nr:nucleotide-binding protein [Rhodospirillales bacterium]
MAAFRRRDEVLVTNEYSHYEGALLRALRIPILILAQEKLLNRCVFENSFGHFISRFPADADSSWLNSANFEQALRIWLVDIKDRRDIFLGYCSSSSSTAAMIRKFLEDELGVSVLDWKRDFSVARTVLDEISEAGRLCSGGIFLFTRDDILSDEPIDQKKSWLRRRSHRPEFAIPRDNVVFEAGYFIGLKGKKRVLIVREQGAKMPADLGGDVYAALESRHDVEPIKELVKRFALAL